MTKFISNIPSLKLRLCVALAAIGTTLAAAADNAGAAVAKAANTLVPSHDIGLWLWELVRGLMDFMGLRRDDTIQQIVYTCVVVVVASVVGLVIRQLVLFVVKRVVSIRHQSMSVELLAQHTFSKCSHFIPPLVFLCLIPFAFTSNHVVLQWIMRVVGVYTLITLGIAISAVLKFAWMRFDERENKDNHPLKGILNVVLGLVWIIILIISVSIIIDKSPMTLLAGLGAFAAALMLIFKDSILGFVAGIQLSTNDMLRVGDWIVVPSTIANGVVKDVTLTVVKVQNWDNTMVMLPPYTLVSTSFQNWRNMYAVGGRQISYNCYIDRTSVAALSPELLADVTERFPIVKPFVEKLQEARAKGTDTSKLFAEVYNNSHGPNGTIDTNLGLFRAYLTCYLIANPQIISDTMDMLVSNDPPQSFGIALNIYCFSRQTSWAQYEAIQSEIVEHVYATAPLFGLKLYNHPNGNNFDVATIPGPRTAPTPSVPTPAPAAPTTPATPATPAA